MSPRSYYLEVFGTARLLAPGGATVSLSPRALAYVISLRLRPNDQLKTIQLSSLFWSAKELRLGANSLSALRKELRHAAPGLLKPYDRGHRFEAEVVCDVDRLAGISAEEQMSALALLSRGFMRDFAVPSGADAFARWMQAEASRYRKQFMDRWKELTCPEPAPPLMVTLGRIGLMYDSAWDEAAVLLVRGLVRQGAFAEAETAAKHFLECVPEARATLVAELQKVPRDPGFQSGTRENAWESGGSAIVPEWSGAPDGAVDGELDSPRSADQPSRTEELALAPPPSVVGTRARLIGQARLILPLTLIVIAIAASTALFVRRPCDLEDYAALVVSQDYQPGSDVPPGQVFTKGWRLRNVGRCAWRPPFYLHFESARRDGAPWSGNLSRSQADIRLGQDVQHAEEFLIRVPMLAPTEPGSYEEAWSLRDGRGHVLKVDDSISLIASISVLPARVARCGSGEARDTLVAPSINPRRSFRPLERVSLAITFRNTAECSWSPGSRLSLDLPPGFEAGDTSASTSNEVIRPKRSATYQRDVRVPARAGNYIVKATLLGGDGTPISPHPWSVAVRVGERDDYGGYPPCGPGEAGPRFVTENFPDNSILAGGTKFRKIWTLTNASPRLCAWRPGVILRRASGDSLSLVSEIRLGGVVLPGEVVTITAPMRAPESPGVHREDWEFLDWTGRKLEISQTPTIWTVIIVPPPAS